MTIKNSAYKLENIDSSKIITPVSLYQRKTDTARVADIAADFDERIANEPKVSFRDGNYFVFDGQHTVMARIKCNGGKHLPILCKVYYDLSAEDEAKLFATQTGFSSNLTSGERLRAKAYANDQTTVNFIKANESLGVDVSFTNTKESIVSAVFRPHSKSFVESEQTSIVKQLKFFVKLGTESPHRSMCR